jgi:hypothetical protein
LQRLPFQIKHNPNSEAPHVRNALPTYFLFDKKKKTNGHWNQHLDMHGVRQVAKPTQAIKKLIMIVLL